MSAWVSMMCHFVFIESWRSELTIFFPKLPTVSQWNTQLHASKVFVYKFMTFSPPTFLLSLMLYVSFSLVNLVPIHWDWVSHAKDSFYCYPALPLVHPSCLCRDRAGCSIRQIGCCCSPQDCCADKVVKGGGTSHAPVPSNWHAKELHASEMCGLISAIW